MADRDALTPDQLITGALKRAQAATTELGETMTRLAITASVGSQDVAGLSSRIRILLDLIGSEVDAACCEIEAAEPHPAIAAAEAARDDRQAERRVVDAAGRFEAGDIVNGQGRCDQCGRRTPATFTIQGRQRFRCADHSPLKGGA